MQTIHPFRLAEWEAVQSKAKKRWLTSVLGERPTVESVRATMVNPHTITLLEWLAFAVLIVLTAFTSYKVAALAVPFATDSLATLTHGAPVADWVRVSFILVTSALFILLATPSVIYFKLLAHEPELVAERKDTRYIQWYWWWRLDYITPRLPSLIVYLSVIWLVFLSSQLPGSPFEQYLPVIVEVGLAALVGNIMTKRKMYQKVLVDAWKERTAPYDERLKNYETDGSYLRILYQIMREELTRLQRPDPQTRKLGHPNAWMEQALESDVYRVVSGEYRRLTAGSQFAAEVSSPSQPTAVVEAHEPPPQKVVAQSAVTLRTPPAGDRVWTPQTLLHDLQVRGLHPARGKYTEADLKADYAPGYDARAAWRAGAKDGFQQLGS
jgi:hypothetical protein